MKSKYTRISAAIGLMAFLLFTATSHAVEGGLGRPISGAGVLPYAGIVPPAPGFALSVGEMYYNGSIGGNLTVPVGQNLTLGIDMEISFTPISLLYIWDTHNDHWNFASGLTVPITWLEAEANVVDGPITGHVKDSATGLFDLAFVPLMASYHYSKTEHLGMGLTVWAPTGEYQKGRLANLSLNTWTFIPNLTYTKIFPKSNTELSTYWGLTFDTENNDTDYQNGILSDFEFLVLKRFKNKWGVGLTGSFIDQITDDGGPTADLLDGFSGRAFGAGPVITGVIPCGKHEIDFHFRWVHEFENRNRVEGDLLMFSGTLKF